MNEGGGTAALAAIVLAGIFFGSVPHRHVQAAERRAIVRHPERVCSLEEPLGVQGTLAFTIRPRRSYRNGRGVERTRIGLLNTPGIARLDFSQGSDACQLRWMWLRGIEAQRLVVNVPELPGPEDYHVLYTWDAAGGRFDGYVNGTPLRLPGTEIPTWSMPTIKEVRVGGGAIEVKSVTSEARYLPEKEARRRVPKSLLDCHADLFGGKPTCPRLTVEGRLGKQIYARALDDAGDTKGWVMEGPGSVRFVDGWMEMASKQPDGRNGHIVYWCPEDLPDRFVAEWEFRAVSDLGLCIVFFAARGERGQDISDPSLPKRNGVFKQYTRGAIKSYHISYYANTPSSQGRITSNMRKNNRFYLVANGPPGIVPGSKDAHQVRLIKDGAHVQFQVDDQVVIDYTDEGKRYGPALADGKFGLRQMQWTVARYRNLRVGELKAE